jgi:hypothetical protein
MRSFMIYTPHQKLSDDQIKNQTGGACGMYGGHIQGFGGET